MPAGAPPTVLIVEDDPLARNFLRDNLTVDGYEVLEAGTLGGARRLLTSSYIDVAVLDLGLPDGDGLALLSDLRGGERIAARVDPDLPVVVLSGRGQELDRLRGFRMGADDYVVKPFSYPELHARLGALLARARRRNRGSRIRVGPLEIDTVGRQVWLDGQPVVLSGKEFSLLSALAADPQRVYTREELLCGVWGFPELCPTRTLDSHACRLRKKLSAGGRRFVINVWGVGYRLVEGTSS